MSLDIFPATIINPTELPTTITITGSPFVYQNTSGANQDVLVVGGTVTTIEFSRDGSTWFLVGLLAGMFGLSHNDRLRVTYLIAPIMTRVAR